jgi:isopentenyldiphosphate isomerase
MEERWDIVNEHDEVITTVTAKEGKKRNLLHRGATIFIFNSKGELFVHKRVAEEDLYPGYYDLAVGGHAEAGEKYEETARREVEEEVGIRDVPLTFLFKMRFTSSEDNCFSGVYKCVYDGPITLQEEEIASGLFLPLEKVEEMLQKEQFCPDSLLAWRKVHETA